MKTVQDVYSEYKLLPILQTHQLRVAGVAKIICEKFSGKIDKNNIILACLFHDMGNIIKSDLNYFPDAIKPQGLEYWEKVKDEYIQKYGKDENIGTISIAKEIKLSEDIIAIIKQFGFRNAKENDSASSFENKICTYSDMRVSPYSVVSMEERITEGRKRYKNREHSISSDNFNSLVQSMRNIEKDIFEKMSVKQEDITNAQVESVIGEFRKLILWVFLCGGRYEYEGVLVQLKQRLYIRQLQERDQS